jgi:hypothetical protein
VRRSRRETDEQYVDRIAADLIRRHPIASMEPSLRFGQYEEWAKEGLQTAMRVAYPQDLQRRVRPSIEYRRQVFTVAEPALALGGYRLADTLNRLFR